jgi:hypothetical protein
MLFIEDIFGGNRVLFWGFTRVVVEETADS